MIVSISRSDKVEVEVWTAAQESEEGLSLSRKRQSLASPERKIEDAGLARMARIPRM
jgi:hypothetical protein